MTLWELLIVKGIFKNKLYRMLRKILAIIFTIIIFFSVKESINIFTSTDKAMISQRPILIVIALSILLPLSLITIWLWKPKPKHNGK